MTYDLNCRIQVQFPHRVYAVIHMPLCEAHIGYIRVHELGVLHGDEFLLKVWITEDTQSDKSRFLACEYIPS